MGAAALARRTRLLGIVALLSLVAAFTGCAYEVDSNADELPVLVLRAHGAEAVLTPHTWCAGDASGYSVCADGAPAVPQHYLRVERGEPLELRLEGASLRRPGEGCGTFCLPGQVRLLPLTCRAGAEFAPTGNPVYDAPLLQERAVLPANVPDGSYLLEVFVYFQHEDGSGGDVAATVPIRVGGEGEPGSFDAAAVSCRTPRPKPLRALPAGPAELDCVVDVTRLTLEEQIAGSRFVFIGSVSALGANEPAMATTRTVRFAVEQTLLGALPSSVDLADSTCGGAIGELTLGGRYLVFVDPEPAAIGAGLLPMAFAQAYLTLDDTAGTASGETGTIEVAELLARLADRSAG